MAAINNDWLDALKGEFSKPYYKKLFETVNQEYRTHRVYPPADDIFNAFHLTPLKDVQGCDPWSGSISWRWTGRGFKLFCETRG